jgi:UDP-glucuronate decarboxylase
LTKSKSKIIYTSLPKDDPIQRKPNIQVANEILNWQPTIDLETGLRKTIKYFNKHIDKRVKR